MTILVFSSLKDAHAPAVMAALTASGALVELLDLSEFPQRLSLSMEFEDGGRRFALVRKGGARLDLADVTSVWWRRPQPFAFPEAMADGARRRFAFSESSTAFQGLYAALDAFWVNEPGRDAAAAHKPWQLALAQAIGLEIPATLMTSDPEAVAAFRHRHGGNVIFKQFLALPDAWRETRLLRPEDEAHLDSVRWAPVIFQRFVEAVADVRVIAIGGELFAAAADVRDMEYPVDVRMNLEARYEAHRLPHATEDGLRALMGRLGLEYGAIDLRLTPEGHYVFLEINPAGQFLYIEHMTGQKIAAALAARLIEGGRLQRARPGATGPVGKPAPVREPKIA
ncbi:MAG TPA: alpha-L-glutamate ligase [Alphaproteobacteria bacterium]|nr:alpha-L-glutamate ligase [Alphaproteobacteria bacterium]